MNTFIVIYDSMSQFVVRAVIAVNATERMKIDAFNRAPFVLRLIQEDKVRMGTGETCTQQHFPPAVGDPA